MCMETNEAMGFKVLQSLRKAAALKRDLRQVCCDTFDTAHLPYCTTCRVGRTEKQIAGSFSSTIGKRTKTGTRVKNKLYLPVAWCPIASVRSNGPKWTTLVARRPCCWSSGPCWPSSRTHGAR